MSEISLINEHDYANSVIIITTPLKAFQDQFRAAKDSIHLFDDPAGALQHWEKRPSYLIFCDAIWDGGKMNGFDLTRTIKKAHDSSRVYLMSSSPNEPNRRWAQRAGAYDLIGKDPRLVAKIVKQEGVSETSRNTNSVDAIQKAFREYVGPVGNMLIEEANDVIQSNGSSASPQAYVTLLASYITDKKNQAAFLEKVQGEITSNVKGKSRNVAATNFPQFMTVENTFREQVGPIADILIEEVRTLFKLGPTSNVQLYVQELANRIPETSARAKFLESLSHLS